MNEEVPLTNVKSCTSDPEIVTLQTATIGSLCRSHFWFPIYRKDTE